MSSGGHDILAKTVEWACVLLEGMIEEAGNCCVAGELTEVKSLLEVALGQAKGGSDAASPE